MNILRKTLFCLSLFALSFSAYSEHGDGGWGGDGYSSLSNATNRLNSLVQYSSLHCHVKGAVNNFTYAVDNYMRCANRGNYGYGSDNLSNIVGGTIGLIGAIGGAVSTFDHGRNGDCYGARNRMQYAFRSVSNYLYDTSWDYPQVYRAYQRTANAMSRY